MLQKKKITTLSTVVLITSSFVFASPEDECSNTGDLMASQIKNLFTAAYHSKENDSLDSLRKKLEGFLVKAGDCSASARANAQNIKNRQNVIMEWHSMNQWLNRLHGFITLNTNKDFSQDWRKEYEIFMEVYELKP